MLIWTNDAWAESCCLVTHVLLSHTVFLVKCSTKKCYQRALSNRKQLCAVNCGVISFWNLKFPTPAGSIQLWILWASIQNDLGTALAGCNEYFDTVCWMKMVTAAGDKPLRRAKLTFSNLNLFHCTHANAWSRIYSPPVGLRSNVPACAILGANSKHFVRNIICPLVRSSDVTT